jgi:hypothetical protein
LAQIAAGGGVTIEVTDPADSQSAWGAHLTQNTGDAVFWAGLDHNGGLTVWYLPEATDTYSWGTDVAYSNFSTTGISSTTPDGHDWLAAGRSHSPAGGVIGATRSGNQLWFAWNAGTDSNFLQAHIELVGLDLSNNFKLIQQVQIWNEVFAFGYPALATNACTGEIGLSFAYGGGGAYENHVVGFLDDFAVYSTTDSNVGTSRYGDYLTIRQIPPPPGSPGTLFSAFGYGFVNGIPPLTGTKADIHYVVFGRPVSSPCSYSIH